MSSPVVVVSGAADVLARWPVPALTAAERERAAAFLTPGGAVEFTAAHLLARECVARVLGVAAADVVIEQTCDTCGGPHGRPVVVGLDCCVSWSHAHGSVAAIAAADRRVGIDLEPVEALEIDRLVSRMATRAEAAEIHAAADPVTAYLTMWTRKEALVKVGELSLDRFGRVDVRAREGLRSWVENGCVVSVAELPQQ